MRIEKTLYQATVSSTGGREGRASNADGSFNLNLTVPRELGGSGGHGTDPEQLFAAGYSACFLGAMKLAAAKEKLAFPSDGRVTATVGIGALPTGFGLKVDLRANVPGLEPEKVRDLMEKAHGICPYSNAIRGNVDVQLGLD